MNLRMLLSASALIFAVGTTSAAWAAKPCGGEIQFAKGKSSTQLTGKVAGYDVCEYTFYAKKGQEVKVSMGANDHPQAFLYSPVEHTFADNQPFILPQNGKYELRIGMTRNDARKHLKDAQPFTATFSITTPQNSNQTVEAASSNYAGGYGAVLPCLTCKGIDTYLSLYEDGSYTLSEQYLGRGEGSSYSQQGTWMAYGKAIILEPENNSDNLYLIAKNHDLYFVSQAEASAAQPHVDARYRLKHQQ